VIQRRLLIKDNNCLYVLGESRRSRTSDSLQESADDIWMIDMVCNAEALKLQCCRHGRSGAIHAEMDFGFTELEASSECPQASKRRLVDYLNAH